MLRFVTSICLADFPSALCVTVLITTHPGMCCASTISSTTIAVSSIPRTKRVHASIRTLSLVSLKAPRHSTLTSHASQPVDSLPKARGAGSVSAAFPAGSKRARTSMALAHSPSNRRFRLVASSIRTWILQPRGTVTSLVVRCKSYVTFYAGEFILFPRLHWLTYF